MAIEPNDQGRPNDRGRPDPQGRDEPEWPFCGDEYPPLKGSPGTVVCTKEPHPAAEWHLNEETGWMWQSRVGPGVVTSDP